MFFDYASLRSGPFEPEIIKQIEKANNQGTDIDLIEIDLKRLWDKLGEITGETYKEELLDEIFSKFCLGK